MTVSNLHQNRSYRKRFYLSILIINFSLCLYVYILYNIIASIVYSVFKTFFLCLSLNTPTPLSLGSLATLIRKCLHNIYFAGKLSTSVFVLVIIYKSIEVDFKYRLQIRLHYFNNAAHQGLYGSGLIVGNALLLVFNSISWKSAENSSNLSKYNHSLIFQFYLSYNYYYLKL